MSRDNSLFNQDHGMTADAGPNKRFKGNGGNIVLTGRDSRADSIATLSQVNEDPTRFLKMNSISNHPGS